MPSHQTVSHEQKAPRLESYRSDNRENSPLNKKFPVTNENENGNHAPLSLFNASSGPGARDAMASDKSSKPPAGRRTDSSSKTPQISTNRSNSGGMASPSRRTFKTHGDTESEYVMDDQARGMAPSQKQLNEYRERLARDLERRETSSRPLFLNPSDKRVSPIPEEALSGLAIPMALNTTATNASTESGNTVRGGMTPANVASTPSYPFPRMASGGLGSRAFTSASGGNYRPSHVVSFEPSSGALDRVLSNLSTPASTFAFNPAGASPQAENLEYPNPNLYELSLMLSAEPGLDAWWNTVVQIMRDVYLAERVTLSIPADSTDIENVPWGQKATYNEHSEDELSLGYMAKSGGSGVPVSDQGTPLSSFTQEDPLKPGALSRPGLASRHSYTSYEDNRAKSRDQTSTASSHRPSYLARSRSYLPRVQAEDTQEKSHLSEGALEEHELREEGHERSIPTWEVPFVTPNNSRGRVLPVLQALNYEADPLIDHAGVLRVIERGKAVTLTRSYPYLDNTASPDPAKPAKPEVTKKPATKKPDPTTKRSAIFGTSMPSQDPARGKVGSGDQAQGLKGRVDDDEPRPPTPKYEEYEQAPPSPWSQSPAPSPAIRADPQDNPFFTDATVDEDSFNPGASPAVYTGLPPQEAIGVDNSWTVMHIPLTHLVLSKTSRAFRLNTAAIDQTMQALNQDESKGGSSEPSSPVRANPAPIAILSILSPVIPYPSNLRHSLEHLAPHMATSFSLCRHFENLETEIAGLHRRRPSTTGFGAVAPDGRPLATTPYPNAPDLGRHTSHTGTTMTSPSEYSGVSKSMTGSPAGTPGWESGSLGSIIDRRQPVASPSALAHMGESYFSSKQRPTTSRHETFGSGPGSRSGPKEDSPTEKRPQSRLSAPKNLDAASNATEPSNRGTADMEEALATAAAHRLSKSTQRSGSIGAEDAAEDMRSKVADAGRFDNSQAHSRHSMLHTYGADFSSTFQSLPPSSSLVSRPAPPSGNPARTMSFAPGAADMPPPSDRLKGLMLDALPAHVFVALPQTGEIVWVNSRYLSYRGQTVADLAEDPWGSIHPDDCDEYLKAWGHSLRTGEQFSRTVRIKRFDGQYRWFYARAVASKDKRGVIMQFLGSYMDIHDQHIAELRAARQEEIEASEAKHRLLANLIPQIIFTATEEDGVTFANEQWLSYTGQSFDDALGLGFLDYVHPEDLAKCRIPTDAPPTPLGLRSSKKAQDTPTSEATSTDTLLPGKQARTPDASLRGVHKALSRHNSSGNSSVYELPSADLNELARKGIIKVGTDSNGRLSYTTEVRLRSKNGEYRWHLIRCVEIDTIDFGSGASSYFGSATDINDHKILETKLKEAMETKGRFLSNMSHEIRTPLIGISGMVSFLQDTILSEEQRDYTNTIQTSANSLIMIINDILDLSKVDAGMMKLKFEWFHTRSLIEDVNELVSTMAIAKGLELNYLVESDVPAWVKGDKVRIRQVLLNVIGNAIKFTTQGEVFSRCRVYIEEDGNSGDHEIMLEYSIIDTGQGFTKQEAELIFKPFSQIDGSSTRQHGGSGLGLVISKQLVELHGGQMSGTAEPGKGSKFVFTARFTLPTAEDHPDLPGSPVSTMYSATSRQPSTESVPGNFQPLPPSKQLRNIEGSPLAASEQESSPVVGSNGSSNPSVLSGRSHATDKSSITTVHTGLARFSEAAKASGQDLSQMKLEMPSGRSSPGRTPTPAPADQPSPEEFRPPMYSILLICPQKFSREATTQHIETTLPSGVPHQITALGSVEEAQELIGGHDPIKFTHIVINLGSAEAVLDLMDQLFKTQKADKTTILVLSDSVQRQAVLKLASSETHKKLLADNQISFIYKPVKPSRFAVIFDPDKVRDLSIDRNRSTAQQMVETQKASYLEIEKRMGNKGYKVLLVEDNPVNQKVLMKYLNKIGVDVEVAVDGAECTDKVLSKPHQYYSLILCDLHMPRKDGYQACREIRHWERSAKFPTKPIIALSANVMSDVQDKCAAAGFSDYVTKPVDFIDLSRAMAKFF